MKRQTFVEIISILYIILFVYAASSKLIDYQKFRVQLGQSPMLTAFAGKVSWMIPCVEIIIAIALSLTRYRISALYASFLLMTLFTTYIFILTHFSEYVPCSCGGILQEMSWNQHFIFNILFMLAAGFAIILSDRTKKKIVIPVP